MILVGTVFVGFINSNDVNTAGTPLSRLEIHYHPRSGLANKVIDLEDVRHAPRGYSSPSSTEPYAPFPSLRDFEFIENALLNNHPASSVDFNYNVIQNPEIKLRSYKMAMGCLDAAVPLHQKV